MEITSNTLKREIAMTPEAMRMAFNDVRKGLTCSKSVELLCEICENAPAEIRNGPRHEKMAWVVHQGFLAGFLNGLDLYNEIINGFIDDVAREERKASC